MKPIKACIAMAAFAALFVAPSPASAVTLTYPAANVAPVGTLIEATNVSHSTTPTQTVFTTSAGNVTCGKATLTGKVTKNSEGRVEGEITTAEFSGTHEKTTSGHCQGNFIIGEKVTPTPSHTSDEDNSLPWCIRAINNKDELTVVGTTAGKKCEAAFDRPVTFTLHGSITCTYEAAQVVATYTTHPAGAIATINKAPVVRSGTSSSFCPATGTLDMSFTLSPHSESNKHIYIDP